MHSKISIMILLAVALEAIAYPTFQANEDGTVSALVDTDEYDNTDDWSPLQYKRFWSPHPSDYNPLRRPVPVPRGSKRDDGVVYHPVPRGITIKQGPHGQEDDGAEGFLEGGRQKKQTRATTLIFRLGSWGLRRKGDKTQPGQVPTPPPNSA